MAAREFTFGTRQRQHDWGWLVIGALFFTGIGSGLFLFSLILGATLGMVVGVVLVLGGGLFLLRDLSRPLVSWRIFSRPQQSWVSRGIIGILSFAVLALIHIIYLAVQPDGWTSLGAPWATGPAWMMALGIVAGIAALFVASYPGFLLGGMRPISLWNSAYIPALFLTSALLGGLGIIYLLPLNLEGLTWALAFLQNTGGVVAIFELILLLGLILLAQNKTTEESVRLLTHGSLRFQFFIGLLGLGLIVPLVIQGIVSIGASIAWLLLIEGILHLFGVFLLRYIIFRAGIYVSLA